MKVYVVITTYYHGNDFSTVGCKVFESESDAKNCAQKLNNSGGGWVVADVREEYVIPSQNSV